MVQGGDGVPQVQLPGQLAQAGNQKPGFGSKPCFQFQKGKCRFGEACKFSHTDNQGSKTQGVGDSNADRKTPGASAESSKEVCQFFKKWGRCKFGDKCRFTHESPAVATMVVAHQSLVASVSAGNRRVLLDTRGK